MFILTEHLAYMKVTMLMQLLPIFLVVGHSFGYRSALLIVDVQDCFLDGGSLAVKEGNDVIPVINKIRNKHKASFSLVVFSQDWHCSDHVSFVSQHIGHSAFEEVALQYDSDGKLCYGNSVPTTFPHARACTSVSYNVTQKLWPNHCIKDVSTGSTSSRIDDRVSREEDDVLMRKGDDCEVDSYSVFYDNGGFRQTSLHSTLQTNGIDSIFITGLALDYCVYYTALDAVKLGYKTFVVADASRGVAPETTRAAVADMVQNGVSVIQSSSMTSFLGDVSDSPELFPGLSTLIMCLAIVMYNNYHRC